MESILNLAALLLGLSAVFGYINHRYLRLPHTIGLTVIALVASFAVLAADWAVPVRIVTGEAPKYAAFREARAALAASGTVTLDFDAVEKRVRVDGRDVVVKIRRPGVLAGVHQDLDILTELSRMLSRYVGIARGYDVVELTRQFAQRIEEELDDAGRYAGASAFPRWKQS